MESRKKWERKELGSPYPFRGTPPMSWLHFTRLFCLKSRPVWCHYEPCRMFNIHPGKNCAAFFARRECWSEWYKLIFPSNGSSWLCHWKLLLIIIPSVSFLSSFLWDVFASWSLPESSLSWWDLSGCGLGPSSSLSPSLQFLEGDGKHSTKEAFIIESSPISTASGDRDHDWRLLLSSLLKMKTCWVLSPLMHKMWELGQVSVLRARLPLCQCSHPVWTLPTSSIGRAECWGDVSHIVWLAFASY